MKRKYSPIKKARFQVIWSLAFLVLAACTDAGNEDKAVTIQWEDRKAVGLIIPRNLVSGPKDSVSQLLRIKLVNSGAYILGEYEIRDDVVVFRPLIAFTRGLRYELTWRDKLLQQIEIPEDATRENPVVVSVYPSGDSLPVNLLKMYIVFSKSMREGQAPGNIAVIKNGQDTISSVFLDLNQELWNKERTILTVWLDPGRIKRDLQPNKTMGAPLEKGNRYEIVIKPGWEDAEGASLGEDYRRNFIAIGRDNQSPDPGKWTIHSPKAGTIDPLRIELHEPLDYLVLKNAVRVMNNKGNAISGAIATDREETVLHFTPSQAWVRDEYTIEIEPRLEDLTGNNLERLFDKDLLKDTADRKMSVYKIKFQVQFKP